MRSNPVNKIMLSVSKHRHARHARVIFLLGGGGDIVVLMEYYVS